MVPEICARGYGAGRVREGSASRPEWLVGWSAAGAAVGVAEENPLKQPMEETQGGLDDRGLP